MIITFKRIHSDNHGSNAEIANLSFDGINETLVEKQYVNVPDTTGTRNFTDGTRNFIAVGNEPVNEIPSSYATKLSPTSSTKANLQKLDANVPDDADFDVWLPLASVHEVNDRIKNSLYGYFVVMAVPNLKGNGYMKETSIEYEWIPPRCSICLLYGHSLVDCPKEGKLVLVDDDGKPLEKVHYLGNMNSGDEVEPIDNETASYLASKLMGLDMVRTTC
uniref:Zinc knuckle CX2CX4HX4C n=1 Tax=Tanacetum cinerariifolium TaxID=118510 RepID=A0A6L2N9A1_TANCI|nr:hypothetical protein [Tanacetum cinerariifolium]